jgi:cysteinyl-tRNA synthetase
MTGRRQIRFYNTLSRKLEPFVPLEAGKVGMYTCGPTVYDYAHIGNFRAYVWEDMLRRFLKHRGFAVTQVMNITDVEDKIIRDSRKAGVDIREYTARYTQAFFRDFDTLGLERAEHYPLATDHIPEMLEIIRKLAENGHTYNSGGSVYFRISSFPSYGSLAHLDATGIRAGARVDSDEYDKDDARDFVLWKAHKEGEPSWESPYGKGRPGWHIECSAMSMKYLGPSFDIHTGGVDNIFPHHENEIAQSEGATGRPFVKHWLHCTHLLADGQKMAKSAGNFYTLPDLVQRGLDPRAIRYFLTSSHYRKPLNFTLEGAGQAAQALQRLDDFCDRLEEASRSAAGAEGDDTTERVRRHAEVFESALDDDMNTAEALAAVFDMVRLVNASLDRNEAGPATLDAARSLVGSFRSVFGVAARAEESLPPDLAALLEARQEARRRKDYAEADRVRAALLEKGIQLEDTPSGIRWKRIS